MATVVSRGPSLLSSPRPFSRAPRAARARDDDDDDGDGAARPTRRRRSTQSTRRARWATRRAGGARTRTCTRRSRTRSARGSSTLATHSCSTFARSTTRPARWARAPASARESPLLLSLSLVVVVVEMQVIAVAQFEGGPVLLTQREERSHRGRRRPVESAPTRARSRPFVDTQSLDTRATLLKVFATATTVALDRPRRAFFPPRRLQLRDGERADPPRDPRAAAAARDAGHPLGGARRAA